ncbi:hypothetical protein P7B02_16915 [Caulobacter segnis]|uniref:hypothetical protein n=1 Tax=Caulobacter segnis TaxID=88688 RepID=UPI00240F964F|nr:hypothetical protein [Caulobacter segnis]MDG2523214.1 hypothetical protein [Caulobacter segnis]
MSPDTDPFEYMMKFIAPALALSLLAGSAVAAPAAPVPGTWLVHGKWGVLAFKVTCRFSELGGRIGGECLDGETSHAAIKGGKRHPIKFAAVKDDRLSWSYRTRWTFYEFDARYTGMVVNGRTMNGQILAMGKTGTFTAVRQ